MADNYKISTIIITKGHIDFLKKCVDSLLLPENAQLVIIVNGYNKETYEYIEKLTSVSKRYKGIFLDVKIPKSNARNEGIKHSDSEIIYFLDDDSYPASGNIELIAKKFTERSGVDIIGGPNITPPGSSMYERVAGYAFSELFTAWKMNERFSKGKKEKNCDDTSVTLCNLGFRKKIFEKENIYFDRRLYYNEENLLLDKYIEKGHRVLYCPGLVVYHHRRKNLSSLAEQIFRSGEGRAMMTRIMPASLRMVYIIPFLFVIYLILLPFWDNWAYVVPLYVYMLFSIVNAVHIIAKYRENIVALPLLVILPLWAHIAYGLGFAVGLIKRNG